MSEDKTSSYDSIPSRTIQLVRQSLSFFGHSARAISRKRAIDILESAFIQFEGHSSYGFIFHCNSVRPANADCRAAHLLALPFHIQPVSCPCFHLLQDAIHAISYTLKPSELHSQRAKLRQSLAAFSAIACFGQTDHWNGSYEGAAR